MLLRRVVLWDRPSGTYFLACLVIFLLMLPPNEPSVSGVTNRDVRSAYWSITPFMQVEAEHAASARSGTQEAINARDAFDGEVMWPIGSVPDKTPNTTHGYWHWPAKPSIAY